MGQDSHGFVRTSGGIAFFVGQIAAEFDMAAVVVHVEGLKTGLSSEVQHVFKGSVDFFSERHIAFGIAGYTGNCDQSLQITYYIIPVTINPI